MNGCLIVETRPFANLDKLIIDHHLKYIPEDWGLTIYCSHKNHHLVKDVDFGRETDIIILNNAFGINDYNKLFKQFDFWDNMPYEKVLIFQTDSKLLRNGIEDFLEWDWVGAAWKFLDYGGNGGLSLRSVEIMKQICLDHTFTNRNEDVLFCQIMKRFNIGNIAPREVCKQFSVETIFGLGSLGVHAIESWLTPEQCREILSQYR